MRTLLQRTIKDKEANLYPIWLMRQAGRYMPEYMAIKKASKGFLDIVSNFNLVTFTHKKKKKKNESAYQQRVLRSVPKEQWYDMPTLPFAWVSIFRSCNDVWYG